MSEYTVFPNAPIAEALLDIQVNLPSDVTLDDLARLQDQVRDRFPTKQERAFVSVQFGPGKGGRPEMAGQAGGIEGYLFFSAEPDATKVVQARLDGFGFSKLKPYETWEAFRNEAHELWDIYRTVARPVTVKRFGLRFINSIDLPRPFRDFGQYITTLPKIAEGVPSRVSEFFMRLVIPYPENDVTAIVTLATNAPQASEDVLPFIFDIDVYVDGDFDPTSEDIWETYEALRRIKNEIFFNSITADTRRLFE